MNDFNKIPKHHQIISLRKAIIVICTILIVVISGAFFYLHMYTPSQSVRDEADLQNSLKNYKQTDCYLLDRAGAFDLSNDLSEKVFVMGIACLKGKITKADVHKLYEQAEAEMLLRKSNPE